MWYIVLDLKHKALYKLHRFLISRFCLHFSQLWITKIISYVQIIKLYVWVGVVGDVRVLSSYDFGWILVINFEYVDQLGGINKGWVTWVIVVFKDIDVHKPPLLKLPWSSCNAYFACLMHIRCWIIFQNTIQRISM